MSAQGVRYARSIYEGDVCKLASLLRRAHLNHFILVNISFFFSLVFFFTYCKDLRTQVARYDRSIFLDANCATRVSCRKRTICLNERKSFDGCGDRKIDRVIFFKIIYSFHLPHNNSEEIIENNENYLVE